MQTPFHQPSLSLLLQQENITTSESQLQPKPKLETTGQKSIKQCGKCREFKPLTEFSKNPTKGDGVSDRCKYCFNIYKTDKVNNLSDAQFLLECAQRRAKTRGREFNITVEDIEAVDTDVCPILNIPIKRYPHQANTGRRKNNQRPDSKSLDRIDASKGYTPGNIRVISWRANSLLSDATPSELAAISNYYLITYGSQI